MEKNKLMRVSLLWTLCLGFGSCVRPGTLSIDLDISTFQGPQPLSRESTPGQFDSSHTSSEERRGSFSGQPSKETSRKRRPNQLENGEMHGGKSPKVSNGSTDDNGQYNGSSSSQGPTLNKTSVPEIVSYDGQGASVQGRAEKELNSSVFRNWDEMMKRIKEREQKRWLCEHYNRCCRVRFPCCTQFYPCHRCHNSASNCKNDKAIEWHATHLKCSLCQFEQEIGKNSAVCSGCGEKMAEYFCYDCKSFKNVSKNPYHCEQCGICRPDKDKMYHCEGCNVCLRKRQKNDHKCLRISDHHVQCCICLEDAFRSCHVWLMCGHKVHPKCAKNYIEKGCTEICPICRQPLKRFSH
ncbi:PREDICTED: uncharacterized RING finger protein C2F3.16-like isoform X2 [Acropora digitifera]|uniref:uncharacterized RING finger protein C2F3.16-like isoform X2 n=1 Tax=Acropora digitifera TaxID=70779 RepID=UPI00077A0D1A|nr:PREDICTED: uncharacterized RING finger protein C2F3.16-like isoform X2 [Acropora digitifera]